MSDTQLQDSVTTAHSTATPGELLSRQRESLGVPISDAARALNLRPAVVDGLEKDNYEEIPVAAYRRGYLRAYAKYLGMDDRVVLEAYQARHGVSDNERKVAPVSVSKPPSKMGAWLFKLVTVLVIVGLIAVTVAWWQSRGGSEPPSIGSSPAMEENETPASDVEPTPAPMPAVTPEPAVTEELTNDETSEPAESVSSAPAAISDEPAMDEGDETAIQTVDADAATDEVEASTAETEEVAEAAPAAATPNLLELTFNEQSWTEIFDANNQRVFVGLQTPGTTASVEGEPPFRLTIGNATGVELRYQGEVVNLAQRAGANNVARFTLGE
ncbi:RodZ domain-containing protein [Vreelandella lutescens]|uniref:Cro/Cl family transcriptional regulator n=1 Tax=Vreelandella lutescens TaxID=1602943 RepID=A0ABQ1NG91_9GAMM|nr:RodZ domain-containing protein [Halomonas lutescens]GGC75790.1 Cro/Cl family transcriptional regulator [Halomonas lutescens]